MKKIIKVMSLALACMLTLTFSAVTAFAEHKSNNGEGFCNNTNYKSSHLSATGSSTSTHTLTTGAKCTISYITYLHRKSCNVCGAGLGNFSSTCTTSHASCGSGITYTCK